MSVFIIWFRLIKCCIRFIRLYKIQYLRTQCMDQSNILEQSLDSRQSGSLYSLPSYRNKSRKNKTQKISKQKKGKLWKAFEERQYIAFIRNNLKTLGSETLRKKKKVFEMMAKKVPTRTSQQCRSHHQKMVLKYGSELNIAALYVKQRQGKKKSRRAPNILNQSQINLQNLSENDMNRNIAEVSSSQLLNEDWDFDEDIDASFQFVQDFRFLKPSNQNDKLRLITEGTIPHQSSDFFDELLQQN